jgi:hypothetical protein
MRAILAAALTATMIGLYAPALSAAPAGFAAPQNATPLTHRTGGWWYGDDYYGGYRPACPWGYYYACRRGPYGYPQCACWPNW